MVSLLHACSEEELETVRREVRIGLLRRAMDGGVPLWMGHYGDVTYLVYAEDLEKVAVIAIEGPVVTGTPFGAHGSMLGRWSTKTKEWDTGIREFGWDTSCPEPLLTGAVEEYVCGCPTAKYTAQATQARFELQQAERQLDELTERMRWLSCEARAFGETEPRTRELMLLLIDQGFEGSSEELGRLAEATLCDPARLSAP